MPKLPQKPVTKPPSKKELRESLERDLQKFINSGGDVTEVPRGVSGRETADGVLKADRWQMDKSNGERTQIPEVLKALDSRKGPVSRTAKPAPKKRPRKKLIYDDFGEPLRWVWVDE